MVYRFVLQGPAFILCPISLIYYWLRISRSHLALMILIYTRVVSLNFKWNRPSEIIVSQTQVFLLLNGNQLVYVVLVCSEGSVLILCPVSFIIIG
jgi:hypothetical protein